MNQCTKPSQKLSKDITSDIFCYPKVGRSITIREAIEKNLIFLTSIAKLFDSAPKDIKMSGAPIKFSPNYKTLE